MNHENIRLRRRALVVSCGYPSFFGSGSKIRAAGLMHMLAAREDVYLAVIDDSGAQFNSAARQMAAICKKILHINVVSNADECCQSVPGIIDGTIIQLSCRRETIADVIRQFYDNNKIDLFFLFRLETYLYLAGAIDAYAVKYLDLDELSYRKNQLIADLKSKNGFVSKAVDHHHAMLKIMEKKVIPLFDKVFFSSELEACEAARLTDGRNIQVLPNIYPSRTYHSRQPAVDPKEILFVGSFFYYPNEDAVHYFCRDIFPLIRQRLGVGVIFRAVGFACPASLNSIENERGVLLMGYQENLEYFYSKASVAVVPLRAGTGTRLKILESFVYGCPIVSTSIGASGLNVTEEKNILLADEPELFAHACLSVLESPGLASRLGDEGRLLHQQYYSPEVLVSHYDDLRL